MHPHLCIRCQRYFADFCAFKRHLSHHVNRFTSVSKSYQRPGVFGKKCHIKYFDPGSMPGVILISKGDFQGDFAQRKKHKKKKRKIIYLNGEQVHSCTGCKSLFWSKTAIKAHKKLCCLKSAHIVDKFECKFCSQIYESQSMLHNHQKIHYYSCILCNAMFTSENILRNHMRTHSTQQQQSPDTSNTSFVTKPLKLSQSLSPNKLSNQNITEKEPGLNNDCWPKFQHAEENAEIDINDDKIETQLYNCDVCSRTLPSEISRDVHQRAHDSVLSEHKCPCCDMISSTSQELDQHFYIHSANDTNICSFCDKSFTKISKLISHEAKHIHGSVNSTVTQSKKVSYECKLCKDKFFSPNGLSKHARAKHKGFRPFNCNVCDKSYILRGDLKRHLSSHSEKLFRCPHCPKVFALKRYLLTHEKIHTGKDLQKCKFCQKQYSVKDIKYHERTHTGEKPYICKTCQKPYASGSALRYHERAVHDRETYFECEHCQKRFYQKNDFVIHVRSHTGEKPYKCDYDNCDKAFSSSIHLTRHKRCLHEKKLKAP